MKRFLLAILCVCSFGFTLRAQYYSVNFDTKTVAAMVAAYNAGVLSEAEYNKHLTAIFKHYGAAEVATAGIFASKLMQRKALTDIGVWSNATENHYYRRIYKMVSEKIIPKIWTVAGMMLRYPQNALYWGSYLVSICNEVKTLCMQFECVVTNSTLSFDDVAFLEIKQEIADVLNLSTFADIDWHKFLDDLAKVPDNFTLEKLKEDVDRLYSNGMAIATTGLGNIGNAFLNQSLFSEAVDGKVDAIKGLYDHYSLLFEQLDQSVGNTVLSMVGGPDNIAGLFNPADYNITAWMTDYLDNVNGQYYTQRWYISRESSGSVTVCNYSPPTDENSLLVSGHWYRIETGEAEFYPGSSLREQILANSESYAGWSRERVRQLNAANDGYNHEMNYSLLSYNITQGGVKTKQAFAYNINVIKSWDIEEAAHEEYFDSYTMDLNTFKEQLNIRLAELNENEEGDVYVLNADQRNYYFASDAVKLQGCENVTISVTCANNALLGKGTTQYKCRSCGSSLNAHTKECAMLTSIGDNEIDFSDIQALITEAREHVAELSARISALEQENRDLAALIQTSTPEEAVALRAQFNTNRDTIEELQEELAAWTKQLNDANAALEEAQSGDDVATDDYYRIPAIMEDCRSAFELSWQGPGSWSGYTYVRKASIPHIEGMVNFEAKLKMARKPKYFLGFKIHRAIIQIDWSLTSDFTQTSVVKILSIDPTMSDEEKERHVNEQINEVVRQYPDCKVSTEYVKSKPVEDETGDDIIHLLWSSDRLDIAREVDVRITKIFSDLVSLEKMMSYKRDILDVLKDVLPKINTEEGRKLKIIEESQKRWIENARGITKK